MTMIPMGGNKDAFLSRNPLALLMDHYPGRLSAQGADSGKRSEAWHHARKRRIVFSLPASKATLFAAVLPEEFRDRGNTRGRIVLLHERRSSPMELKRPCSKRRPKHDDHRALL